MPSHLLSLNPKLDPQTIDSPPPPRPSIARRSVSSAINTMSQPTPAPAPELKTYKGNCHCGAFQFTAKLPELTSVDECNCSICFKKGYKWIQGAEEFVVTKGEGTLKEYKFGAGKMSHQFCPTCGTGVLGKMEGWPPGINANSLQDLGFDIFDLKVGKYDGKAIDPQYVPAKFAGTEPTAEIENAKMYYGGCHCGAVTVAMKTPGPLSDGKQDIFECDCSICTRDGTCLTYPLKTALSVHASSPTALTIYMFGRQFNEHNFCSKCGVSIYIHNKEVPDEVWKKYRGDASQEDCRRIQPANLRAFDGVEWDVLREKGLIERGDWAKMEPLYVCPE